MSLALALARERWLERLALAHVGHAAPEAAAAQPPIVASQPPGITVIAMGGTIDKDYPRSTGGYAFEIDEPAAGRMLSELPPNISINHTIISVCRKDSTEITAADRQALCDAVAKVPPGGRVVVTHGTDTLVESAQALERSGAAFNMLKEQPWWCHNSYGLLVLILTTRLRYALQAKLSRSEPNRRLRCSYEARPKMPTMRLSNTQANGKVVVFTGAMRPERFRQSDATFNLGGAVAATGLIPTGTVAICMGGVVVDSRFCRRDVQTHRFVDTRWGL